MYKLGSLLAQGAKVQLRASQLLRSALRLDPSLSDAHYYLGEGLVGAGQDAGRSRNSKLAIAADPSNDRAMTSYYKLSQIYRKLHRTSEAHKRRWQTYQRMRADREGPAGRKSAQLVRKRTELPVNDARRSQRTPFLRLTNEDHRN